ncbi:MAG: MarR family winged helix-turn-helix transcriptional regulator [Candidatus Dormibacteraceae bacterium]
MTRVTRPTGSKAVQLWEGIARAHSSITSAIEKDMLPKTGIPLAWYEVLAHLRRAPNGMLRFQDLARIEGLTDSGASRRLHQMIKAGLIDRDSCPTDRRGVYAHLTEKGSAAYQKAHAIFLRSLDRNLGTLLEPGEAKAVSTALARLTATPESEN